MQSIPGCKVKFVLICAGLSKTLSDIGALRPKQLVYELQSIFPHMIAFMGRHGLLIWKYVRDYTKLQEGPLCSLNKPNTVLTV